MAQPVYKLWLTKYTNAWYQLSKAEQDALGVKVEASLKSVGGEYVLMRM